MEVVGAIIRNSGNEYLLQQRDENAPTFKHHWTLFGGQVEEGEKPQEALLRELNEELDLNLKDIYSITLVQTNLHENGIVQYVFEALTNISINELKLSEGEAIEYVPEGSLFDRNFAFNIKDVLEKYIKDNR